MRSFFVIFHPQREWAALRPNNIYCLVLPIPHLHIKSQPLEISSAYISWWHRVVEILSDAQSSVIILEPLNVLGFSRLSRSSSQADALEWSKQTTMQFSYSRLHKQQKRASKKRANTKLTFSEGCSKTPVWVALHNHGLSHDLWYFGESSDNSFLRDCLGHLQQGNTSLAWRVRHCL